MRNYLRNEDPNFKNNVLKRAEELFSTRFNRELYNVEQIIFRDDEDDSSIVCTICVENRCNPHNYKYEEYIYDIEDDKIYLDPLYIGTEPEDWFGTN